MNIHFALDHTLLSYIEPLPSWLMRVDEQLKEQMLESTEQTHWVPNHVKDKRFHNWLENARDWCISRSRFWGTPLPIWISDDREEVVVMDSVEKLEKLSGVKVFDLHRHHIDQITIPSSRGPEFGVLRRVEDVKMDPTLILDDITGKLREYVLEELNVRSLVTCNDTLKYASLKAEPDFSVLGKRLGKSMGLVAKQVKEMSQQDILRFQEAGKVTIAGHTLVLTDIKIVRLFKRPDGLKDTEIDANGDGDVLVLLDLRPDDSLYEAGVAREIVNRIQKLRKKSGLEPTDFVEVYIESLDKDESALQQVLSSQEQYIKETIGSSLLPSTLMPSHAVILSHETFQNVSKLSFKISLARPALKFNEEAILALCSDN